MILLPSKKFALADAICIEKVSAIYVFMDMVSNEKFPFCIKFSGEEDVRFECGSEMKRGGAVRLRFS